MNCECKWDGIKDGCKHLCIKCLGNADSYVHRTEIWVCDTCFLERRDIEVDGYYYSYTKPIRTIKVGPRESGNNEN